MLETAKRQLPSPTDLHSARDVLGRLKGRLTHAVRGRDDVTDLLLVALMADGHVLLEDFPGSGKTTLAKALGESILPAQGESTLHSFRRVQFTPDLLPSDITGVSIFEPKSAQFHFQPGPLFAYVVLADEINRTSPKVQAAMLESMAEKQVTADNVTYPLDDLFFVIATQNPRDQVGTYPLPVAQLDRFLFKIVMVHIDRESELEVLTSYKDRRSAPPHSVCTGHPGRGPGRPLRHRPTSAFGSGRAHLPGRYRIDHPFQPQSGPGGLHPLPGPHPPRPPSSRFNERP